MPIFISKLTDYLSATITQKKIHGLFISFLGGIGLLLLGFVLLQMKTHNISTQLMIYRQTELAISEALAPIFDTEWKIRAFLLKETTSLNPSQLTAHINSILPLQTQTHYPHALNSELTEFNRLLNSMISALHKTIQEEVTKGGASGKEALSSNDVFIIRNNLLKKAQAIRYELELHNQRMDAQLNKHYFYSVYAFLFLAVVSIFGTLISFFWFRNHLKETKLANKKLIGLQEELERRVAAQTEEIRKNEEFLRQAVTNAAIGLFEHDLIHEQLILSEQAQNMFKVPDGKPFTFEDFLQIIHPEDFKTVRPLIAKAHNPQLNGQVTLEHRLLFKDGSVRWVSTRGQTFFEGEGIHRRATKTIGAILDVTERKQSELALNEVLRTLTQEKRKLEESNQSLERFASVVAHDLRAPIRSLGLWVDFLNEEEKHFSSPSSTQAFEHIKTNLRQAELLIEGLLEIAKITHLPEPSELIDLNQITKTILANFDGSITKLGAQITTTQLPILTAVGSHFESVLTNLIGNALTYHSIERTPEIHISCIEEAECYRFEVKDNGIGIGPQYRDRIFQMFQRLHSEANYPGTGIGLALCKSIVEGWDGKIGVDSLLGRGSTFYFTFPKPGICEERKTA